MTCKTSVQFKDKRVCIGDLNKQIDVEIRAITPKETVDFTETFSDVATVWSKVVTTRGVEVFDGVNLSGLATHLFYIKYLDGVEKTNFVDYNGKRYVILDVENQNENNEILILKCEERGTKTVEVNWR